MADDPYLYPGTDVLRNKFGLRDANKLRVQEYRVTRAAAACAPLFPVTAAGYRQIHKHLFEDVYQWAGKLRTTDLAKGQTMFARQAFVESQLLDRFRQMEREGNFQNLDDINFAGEAAHHISELNAIHPFREGNGRTMRLHLKQIAQSAGHRLDFRKIQGAEWVKASIAGFQGDEQSLAQLIGMALGMNDRQLGQVRDAADRGHGR